MEDYTIVVYDEFGDVEAEYLVNTTNFKQKAFELHNNGNSSIKVFDIEWACVFTLSEVI